MELKQRKIRFGLIGCGVNGTKQHSRLLADMPDAELVAVCDNVESKAKKLGELRGVPYYTDHRELLKRDDIDVVTISLPSGLHAEYAIACAEAGKHAIVEKPMDITLEKADRLISTFRKAGLKLTVISQHRFDPATVQVKKDIAAGKFGRLILGTAAINWYRSQAYYDSGDWRGTWAFDGGGALMNQSIHTIDLLQYFFGKVDSIYAHCVTMGHQIEVEDAAVATVRFESGAIGTIVGTTCAYPGVGSRLEIFGEKGTAIIERGGLAFSAFREEGETDEQTKQKTYRRSAANYDEDGGASQPDAIEMSAHRLQIEDMIAAIREDRDPLVTGEEGRLPLEIILAIYCSAKTGQPVKLPLT
ncbi:MAG: oxidoreductase [Paenibacillaceae bacterium]|jgi:predicted dehydrogenase|nr:oxidoreductase [Paenibacillaceae bacterium]